MQAFIGQYIPFVLTLSSTEFIISLLVTALLLVLLVYKYFGLGAALGLLAIYFFVYILVVNNVLPTINERNAAEGAHLNLIQEEANKGIQDN